MKRDPDNEFPAAIPGKPQTQSTPVSILTGFLGSGKTTLLRSLLRHAEFTDTAVIINEFGEIGLDHELVEAVDQEVVLLGQGCVCCALAGDLVETLRSLHGRRHQGRIPPFRRVIVETTGLADPAPSLQTLMDERTLVFGYRLDAVIATVDARNGEATFDRHAVSVKQAAVADRLMITKTDIAATESIGRISERLMTLNPRAEIFSVSHGDAEPRLFFHARGFDPETAGFDPQQWLGPLRHEAHPNKEHDRIYTTSVCLHEPLNWTRFSRWMEQIVEDYGQDLLRVKGILDVSGENDPVVIHGVQHFFHPVVRLRGWQGERQSRVVFVTYDLDPSVLVRSLKLANLTRQE